MLRPARAVLARIQSALNFEGCRSHPLFAPAQGLGRVATLAAALGLVLGLHLALFLMLSWEALWDAKRSPRMVLAWQWNGYMVLFCAFHLLEFFTTAVYNSSQATADSFLVNHSTAYTMAFLGAIGEFWLRFCLRPSLNVSAPVALGGLVLALLAQGLRTAAMRTAGESFNHYIQTTRKDNHVLVTRGVYRYLRHPSYVGFCYWSVGTQLLLGNRLLALASGVASWRFFKRRIAYEEESLCQLFPEDYPSYVARSYTGIPFIFTRVNYKSIKVE